MTAETLLTLDLVISALATAAWVGAGVTVAVRRPAVALALLAVAVAATLARVGLVVALAGHGWWFVQEKVTLTLPLLVLASGAAVVVAGPPLVRRRPGGAVALLTAGYAAGAGLFVTAFLGYPAGWTDALVTVAVVVGAALATAQVMSPESSSGPPRLAAVATLAVGLVGVGTAFAPGATVDGGGGPTTGEHADHGPPAASRRGPTAPDPGGSVRRYTLTARTATVSLSSGRRVDAWTFDGTIPGPPVTATVGDLVEATLRNADIAAGVTLHWHGYDVPVGEDGVPGLTQDAVLPGHEFVYRFLANRPGTYWYHTHEASDEGVRMGLYGALVVDPRVASPSGVDLTIPVHSFAGVTVLGDRDELTPRTVAPGTPVRLRLIDTDNGPRRFTIDGTSFRLVAVDGTDLNGPTPLAHVGLRVPAGGRYDVAFDMPAGPVALLVDDDPSGGLRLLPSASTASTEVVDTSGWPELDLTTYGAPAPNAFGPDSRFDRDFTLVLDRGFSFAGGRPRYAYTVNGEASPSIPTMVVREGDLVRMTVVNRGLDTHPWHLHGHRVLVLSRDGRTPTGSPLWLDTFDVRPGEVWQVAFRALNPGVWMNHCHNLAHADQGMMLHLAYES